METTGLLAVLVFLCLTREDTFLYTHSSVARTFLWCTYIARTLRTFLCVFFTCMAHGSRVSAMRMSSSLSHLTFSFLMFHPSLLLLFLDGHFETTPGYDLTDFDVHDFLLNFPDLKAQFKRTPREDEEFGYLAKAVPNTGYEPKDFDKITSADGDRTLINDPNYDNISDFSKITGESRTIRCSHSV